MSQVLRQSTAVTVRIGPFMDATNGVTPETGITIAAADQAEILKAGGVATVTLDSANNLVAITGCDGWYDLDLGTDDTSLAGTLDIVIQDASVCLPVFARFIVMDAISYDAIYGETPTLLTARDIGQLYESTVLSPVSSQTNLTMNDSFSSTNNWQGNIVTIQQVSTGETVTRWVASTNHSTDLIVLNAAPTFTIIPGDIVRVESRIHPMYANNLYDAATGAEAVVIRADIKNYARVLARKDAAIAIDNATEHGAINANQGNGAGNYNNVTDSLEATDVASMWTTVLTEDYATLGAQGTAAQMMYTIQQFLTDADITGTTMTIRKRNGTTAAYTITLNSSTTPTDKNRAS